METNKILHHLIKNQKPIFGIHGGGNVGLGCMADIVSRSKIAYQIVATSSDELMNHLINSNQHYWLKHGNKHKGISQTEIKNVTMLNYKIKHNMTWLYVHADLLAICLPEHALINMSQAIALGIKKRYETHGRELTVLILMNKPHNDFFVKSEITKALLFQTKNSSYVKNILNKIKFIPTVVDRIVNKIERRKIIDSIRDKSKFYLFSAERHFALYVPETMEEAAYFPDMTPVANLHQFAEIKNKYMNAPHTILAWMGGLMGCKTIAEAINNSTTLSHINNLMECEIAPILKAEYPELSKNTLISLKKHFINRCKSSTEDPIERVARDPLRKLDHGGRIRGIIELRQKHRLNIAIPELEQGIAAGLLYAINKIDPNNEECKKIHDIYQSSHSYKSILCYKGPYRNRTYSGLDSFNDRSLINNILKRMHAFKC
jgi:mannitol-1-phosphate/altronate dehydrogenase